MNAEKEITNPFQEGQEVICISDNFPIVTKYGAAIPTDRYPKKGEHLVINEILGDYIRFDIYDSEESFNWWFHNRFRAVEYTDSYSESYNYATV